MPRSLHSSLQGLDFTNSASLSCIFKTGHDLSRKLRDLLLEAKHRADGGLASNDRENTFMPRQHERDTGCPHALVLTPGMIHTQASPDFFCNPVSWNRFGFPSFFLLTMSDA